MTSTNLKLMEKKMDSKVKSPKAIRRLLKLMLPYKKRVILACLCVIIVNATQLIKPYILKLVIDDFLTKHIVEDGFYSITTMGILYFAIVALSCFFSITQVMLINKVGQDIMRLLRSRVFKTVCTSLPTTS